MPRFLDVITFQSMADARQFRIASELRYEDNGPVITVPKGFVTDLASIPQAFWNILPPWGPYGPAAVLHDWLYWDKTYWGSPCPRCLADDIFRDAMNLLAVPTITVNLIHAAVRQFGQAAWDRNAELRASGYTRMSTGPGLPPYASPITQPEGSTS